MTVPPPPPGDEQNSNGGIQKPRRAEGWLLAVGAVILIGLLGHLLNQQRTSTRPPDIDAAERTPRESAPAPTPEAQPSDAPSRDDAGTLKPKTVPSQMVYMVTHKHRLRDCHGRLTFTRNGLRFDSDEPEDSFDVGRDDVTIEGDVLRIRDKAWRFEFSGDVRVERLFSDWKAGNLSALPAP
jgi:hypothetical protein